MSSQNQSQIQFALEESVENLISERLFVGITSVPGVGPNDQDRDNGPLIRNAIEEEIYRSQWTMKKLSSLALVGFDRD